MDAQTKNIWTIDTKQERAIYWGEPLMMAKILQTQVGFVRNELGNMVELEVLHSCVTKDGHRFTLDDSIPFTEESPKS